MSKYTHTTQYRLIQLRMSEKDYETLRKYATHLRIPITSAVRMIVMQKFEEVTP